MLGNSGKYPFARDVGYVGTRMSAERQKIRAAEWLYRWNLSMSILGIVFTILTFVGVFTLVLRQYFAEFGLNEVEVLLVLLLIVLTVIFGFGFYLDKFLRFWSAQTTVATVRNQFLTSALYQKELLIMKYSQVPQMEGMLHLIEDLLSGLRVELPGGLVRQEERRVIGEGHSDGDTLLLSPAQLVGAVARTLRHAHELEQLLPAFRTDRGALPCEPQRQFDVFFGGERGDQVGELKDEADLRESILDEISISEVNKVGTIHLDSASGVAADPVD